MSDHPLKSCHNPACERLTSAMYCCLACSTAHEDKYEIHEDGVLAHSEGCNARWAERRKVLEAPRRQMKREQVWIGENEYPLIWNTSSNKDAS